MTCHHTVTDRLCTLVSEDNGLISNVDPLKRQEQIQLCQRVVSFGDALNH